MKFGRVLVSMAVVMHDPRRRVATMKRREVEEDGIIILQLVLCIDMISMLCVLQ